MGGGVIGAIFSDFGKALAQWHDRRFRHVVLLGLALAILLLVVMTVGFVWLLGWLIPDTPSLPIVGEVTWVGDLVTLATVFLMIFLSVFLMMPVASAFTGLFLEDVAAAVELKHYAHLPPVPRFPVYESIKDSINYFGVLIAVNLLALALVVLTAGLAFPVFYLANGYLLGREYFQMVAMRRIGEKPASALRKQYRGQIWIAGTLMALPLSVPLVNLLIPVFGVATFTHLFHRVSGSSGD